LVSLNGDELDGGDTRSLEACSKTRLATSGCVRMDDAVLRGHVQRRLGFAQLRDGVIGTAGDRRPGVPHGARGACADRPVVDSVLFVLKDALTRLP